MAASSTPPSQVWVEGCGQAVLGGCFNPVHLGHLRLALALHEVLHKLIGTITFLPSAHPPHKPEEHMLPFPLRAELVRSAIAPYPWLACSTMEAERDTPSYTWDTLGLLQKRLAPDQKLFFILGIEDYAQLPTWHNGLHLPERATLLVISREHYHTGKFAELTKAMWPSASCASPATSDGLRMQVGSASVLFQPVPLVPISSSLIRERWLAGRPIDEYVPAAVSAALEENRQTVLKHWSS